MDTQSVLSERFAQAIRKCFDPCPLIGPKWVRACEGPAAGAFEFVGVSKLAKATAKQPAAVAQMLCRNLDLSGLALQPPTIVNDRIVVRPAQSAP